MVNRKGELAALQVKSDSTFLDEAYFRSYFNKGISKIFFYSVSNSKLDSNEKFINISQKELYSFMLNPDTRNLLPFGLGTIIEYFQDNQFTFIEY